MTSVPIGGHTASGFEAVAEEFERNFTRRGDIGGSFAVAVEGQLVVDLWGGHRDASRSAPWVGDTIVNTFSVTKGVASLAMHRLIDRGTVDLDERVATYWPEFGSAGKENVTVRDVMGHLAGLPWLKENRIRRGDLYDWQRFCTRLATAEPLWPPSTRPLYHALTFGHLVGEIASRADGRSFALILEEELLSPAGVDYHVGLDEDQFPRVAELVGPSPLGGVGGESADFGPNLGAQRPLSRLAEIAGTAEFRAATIPSVNGHGNARSIAQLYSHAANPGGLFTSEAVERMGTRQYGAADWSTIRGGRAAAWACGFMPNWTTKYGPNPAAFGHDGFGGSFGGCDPAAKVSFGFAINHLSDEQGWDDRGASLIRTFYAAQGSASPG